MQELWMRGNRRGAHRPPTVILIEMRPGALQRSGYAGGASSLVEKLRTAGYGDVSHSGCVLRISFLAD